MLSEEQCRLIETGLNENVESRKVAVYLCLHMGLIPAEIAALRWQDIDIHAGSMAVRNIIGRSEGNDMAAVFMPSTAPRVLPMPPHVQRYLSKHRGLYASSSHFILTGETAAPSFYHIQNVLTSVCTKYGVAAHLSATDLRNAFIRRCIQSGMDLYSLCAYIGIKQPNVIVKRFGQYFTIKPEAVNALEKYGADYKPLQPALAPGRTGPKRMNLLILGAGSQGPVVKEIAEAIGVFNEIAFLDDDPGNTLAIGTLSDYRQQIDTYPMAIPSFGDSNLRQAWVNRLEGHGYIVPTLIHPTATVSPSAKIGAAVVIEAKSIISAGVTIEKGVIVSSGSVVEVAAKAEQYSHIGSSVMVGKGAVIPARARISSGTIIRAE